jgi:signal transduction histidine kinase
MNLFGDKMNSASGSKEIARLREENVKLKDQITFYQMHKDRIEYKISELEKTVKSLEEKRFNLEQTKLRLEELNIQKDELFTSVVHDIKNPVSTIRNFVQLLKSYDLTAKEQSDIMQSLLSTSSRIFKLVEEVSRVISNDRDINKLHPELGQINDVVENIYGNYEPLAHAKNIVFKKRLDRNLPLIMFDQVKIGQVIDNLVNNAVKFSPRETEITVSTFQDEDNIVCEIKDTGYGLSQEEIIKAFEKGVVLSNKPTNNESSSGIGLWIVKKIIEQHSGRVWVKSKLGSGSTFAFKLPIKKEKIT